MSKTITLRSIHIKNVRGRYLLVAWDTYNVGVFVADIYKRIFCPGERLLRTHLRSDETNVFRRTLIGQLTDVATRTAGEDVLYYFGVNAPKIENRQFELPIALKQYNSERGTSITCVPPNEYPSSEYRRKRTLERRQHLFLWKMKMAFTVCEGHALCKSRMVCNTGKEG